MVRLALGAVLAAVVLFFFGFLYWGLNPLPYRAWHQASDDVAAGAALKQHFPEAGTYFVPAMTHAAAEHEKLSADGPVAMIHILPQGKPLMDPNQMGAGFVLGLLVSVGMALVIWIARAALVTWAHCLALSLAVGLVAAILVDGGDVVWWFASPSWALSRGLYDAAACLVAGGVVGLFRPRLG